MTLFNDGTDQEPVVDQNTDYLKELTKPGAKFDRAKYTTELEMYKDIAKGKWHSDQTIDINKRRMDQMRADYEKEREQNLTRAQLEDVLTKYGRTPLASSETPPANEDINVKPTIDPEQIKGLITSEYQSLRERERQEQNEQSVKVKLTERYGPNYQNALSQQAAELGLSGQEVEHLARTNPKMFARTFGLDQPQRREAFETPMRNTMSFQPTSGQDRTWSYYQKLKADEPKKYYSPKIQNQMLADYDRLGSKFEDGDFQLYN